MPSAACSIYGLFITCIISTLLGIATLVLNIIFKYIGFVDNDIALSTCTDIYLMHKYKHLSLQLQTSFVGICLGLLMNLIVLVLIILTIKNLRQFKSQNNPQQNQKILPEVVLSKTKNSIIYVLLSFGTLGNIICFGSYLTIYIESQKNTSTCSFSYNDTNLLILVIITGVWLLSFLIEHVFVLIAKGYFAEDQIKQQRKNKYKQMINVTQEPGTINYNEDKIKPQDKYKLNYGQFTQEPYEGQIQSFGNPNSTKFGNNRLISKQQIPQQSTFNRNSTQLYLNPPNNNMETNQMNNLKKYDQASTNNNYGVSINKQSRQTFQQYKQRQLKQAVERKLKQESRIKTNSQAQSLNPHHYKVDVYSPTENKHISKQSDQHGSDNPSNQFGNNLKFNNQFNTQNNYQKQQSQFYSSSNNVHTPPKYIRDNSRQNYENKNSESIRENKFLTQPDYNNPFSKPFSPIKILNEQPNELENSRKSPPKYDPYRNQPIGRFGTSPPQRVFNNHPKQSYRPQLSYRDANEQNTRGQLVFHKKPLQQSRRTQNQPNQRSDIFRNDQPRYDKNSSGEVSFKSPSRFDTKFAEQQRNYLSKNTQGSILPASYRIKQSIGQRSNILDEKYSSGMQNSNFGQSRGQQSVPSLSNGKSRSKARQGVLTSFIRGKFS